MSDVPQWSRSLKSGVTRGRARAPQGDSPAAMEPLVEERGHGGSTGRCGHSPTAAMEPLVEERGHPPGTRSPTSCSTRRNGAAR